MSIFDVKNNFGEPDGSLDEFMRANKSQLHSTIYGSIFMVLFFLGIFGFLLWAMVLSWPHGISLLLGLALLALGIAMTISEIFKNRNECKRLDESNYRIAKGNIIKYGEIIHGMHGAYGVSAYGVVTDMDNNKHTFKLSIPLDAYSHTFDTGKYDEFVLICTDYEYYLLARFNYKPDTIQEIRGYLCDDEMSIS